MSEQRTPEQEAADAFTTIEYAVLRYSRGMDKGELAACKAHLAQLFAQRAAMRDALQTVVGVIDSVENRCMAADGPVTPTCDEITDADLRRIFESATAALAKASA